MQHLFISTLQFSAGSIPELFRIVRSQPLEFPASPAVSPQLQDLLTRMLAKVSTAMHVALLVTILY